MRIKFHTVLYEYGQITVVQFFSENLNCLFPFIQGQYCNKCYGIILYKKSIKEIYDSTFDTEGRPFMLFTSALEFRLSTSPALDEPVRTRAQAIFL
jgi:hypothetical protein